jgi:hypothetical protein
MNSISKFIAASLFLTATLAHAKDYDCLPLNQTVQVIYPLIIKGKQIQIDDDVLNLDDGKAGGSFVTFTLPPSRIGVESCTASVSKRLLSGEKSGSMKIDCKVVGETKYRCTEDLHRP